MPLVSVIIPCFNQGNFIYDSVNSVLNQVYQDFEIIIVDDGSDDESTLIKLNNFNHPKIKVIHTGNRGLAAARNRGFREAMGKFIQFLDADDTIQPDKFQEQLRVFEQHPGIDVCFTNYLIFDLNKQLVLLQPETISLGINPLEDFLYRWERDLCIPIHAALFRREIWSGCMPFNEELKAREDWLMWCEVCVKTDKFYFLNKPYAVYRYHSNNMSRHKLDMLYNLHLAVYYIMQVIPNEQRKKFLNESVVLIKNIMEKNLYPDLINKIDDLKNKFKEMDKSIDYKIGHFLLIPYRLFKSRVLGKKYL